MVLAGIYLTTLGRRSLTPRGHECDDEGPTSSASRRVRAVRRSHRSPRRLRGVALAAMVIQVGFAVHYGSGGCTGGASRNTSPMRPSHANIDHEPDRAQCYHAVLRREPTMDQGTSRFPARAPSEPVRMSGRMHGVSLQGSLSSRGSAPEPRVPAFVMAHAHFHQVQDDLREPYRALGEAIPDVMTGYHALHNAAFVDGALVGQDQGAHRARPSPSPGSATGASPPTAATWPAGAPPRRRSPR